MAQCRIKKLEKMDVIEKVTIESTIQFNFPKPEHVPPPLIKIENGVFGYTEDKILYTDIQFGVDMDSRIAIAGSNGAGKSTLINLLMGNLSLLEG
jgi:ATPase subunit of ABC transporter with duplicated ATPase domains